MGSSSSPSFVLHWRRFKNGIYSVTICHQRPWASSPSHQGLVATQRKEQPIHSLLGRLSPAWRLVCNRKKNKQVNTMDSSEVGFYQRNIFSPTVIMKTVITSQICAAETLRPATPTLRPGWPQMPTILLWRSWEDHSAGKNTATTRACWLLSPLLMGAWAPAQFLWNSLDKLPFHLWV